MARHSGFTGQTGARARGEIPDKAYFKIGEVARITGVKPYVLRYWETEFHIVRPQKSRSRQRLYQRRDVQLLIQIRHLLYDEGYTIAGARKRLREQAQETKDDSFPGQPGESLAASDATQRVHGELEDRAVRISMEALLGTVRQELKELVAMLEEPKDEEDNAVA